MRDWHGRFIQGHAPVNQRDPKSGKFLPIAKEMKPVVPEKQPVQEEKHEDASQQEAREKADGMIVKPYRNIRF